MDEKHRRINLTIIQISTVASNWEELIVWPLYWCGVGEQNCFYQHKFCFGRTQGCQSFQLSSTTELCKWSKKGKQEKKGMQEAEKYLWKSGGKKRKKLLPNKANQSLTQQLAPCLALWMSAPCVGLCILTRSNQNRVNKTKTFSCFRIQSHPQSDIRRLVQHFSCVGPWAVIFIAVKPYVFRQVYLG